MLLPALQKAREQAKLTQCLSNLRQIGLGAQMYRHENSDWYPPRRIYVTTASGTPTSHVSVFSWVGKAGTINRMMEVLDLPIFTYYHGGKGQIPRWNAVFADGHAATIEVPKGYNHNVARLGTRGRRFVGADSTSSGGCGNPRRLARSHRQIASRRCTGPRLRSQKR